MGLRFVGQAFLSIADDVVKQRYSDAPSPRDADQHEHTELVAGFFPWNFLLRSSPMLSKLSRQNLAKEAASWKLRSRTPEFLGSVAETSQTPMKWGANISSCMAPRSDVAEVFRCRGATANPAKPDSIFHCETGYGDAKKIVLKIFGTQSITQNNITQQSWESNSSMRVCQSLVFFIFWNLTALAAWLLLSFARLKRKNLRIPAEMHRSSLFGPGASQMVHVQKF